MRAFTARNSEVWGYMVGLKKSTENDLCHAQCTCPFFAVTIYLTWATTLRYPVKTLCN
jgi:hypothetical protein